MITRIVVAVALVLVNPLSAQEAVIPRVSIDGLFGITHAPDRIGLGVTVGLPVFRIASPPLHDGRSAGSSTRRSCFACLRTSVPC